MGYMKILVRYFLLDDANGNHDYTIAKVYWIVHAAQITQKYGHTKY